MKAFTFYLIALCCCFHAVAQHSSAPQFLQAGKQTKMKSSLYYVYLHEQIAEVYKMGTYFDKGGSGPAISQMDTLILQDDGSYRSRSFAIHRKDDGSQVLMHLLKKEWELPLSAMESPLKLNNAWYLHHYFAMGRALAHDFPMHHHSYWRAYNSWDYLPQKDMPHPAFREFVRERIQFLKDSLYSANTRYKAVMDHIVLHAGKMDYAALKDSLALLPPEYRGTSMYYPMAIMAVAAEQPEYFFRLAEDYPEQRSKIFMAVNDDREVVKKLKLVEGHDVVKKEFIKDVRLGKSMPYRVIGTYAAIGGIIAAVAFSQ